jgi:hypothetical protein
LRDRISSPRRGSIVPSPKNAVRYIRERRKIHIRLFQNIGGGDTGFLQFIGKGVKTIAAIMGRVTSAWNNKP